MIRVDVKYADGSREAVMTRQPLEQVQAWIKETLATKSWLVLQDTSTKVPVLVVINMERVNSLALFTVADGHVAQVTMS